MTRTQFLIAVAINLAVMLYMVSLAYAQSADVEGSYIHVRDVDTIVVNDIPVRLNGVDGPELDTPVGREAKWYMEKLLNNRTVSCYLTGAKTYDREVGTCFIVDDFNQIIDIGQAAIAASWALDCPKYSNGKYAEHETLWGKAHIQRAEYCS